MPELLNLLCKEIEQNGDNLVDGVRREKDCEGRCKEAAHAGTDRREVSAVQDDAPVGNGLLDVHVQQDVGPFGTGFFS